MKVLPVLVIEYICQQSLFLNLCACMSVCLMCVSLDLSLYRSECVFPSMCETLSVLVCRVYLLVGGFVFVLCGFDIKVFLCSCFCVLGCD